MLVELAVVDQRTKAVYAVLDGADVTEVARSYGVCRQTVHTWLMKYANEGFSALVDKSSRPDSCPHQMPAAVEARVVELRRSHPDWGQRTIVFHLAKEGVEPLPSKSAICRCLVRHGLVEAKKRKRKKQDYRSCGSGSGTEVHLDKRCTACAGSPSGRAKRIDSRVHPRRTPAPRSMDRVGWTASNKG